MIKNNSVILPFLICCVLTAALSKEVSCLNSGGIAFISGQVYDGYTNEPLPGTTVRFGKSGATLTDGKGRFRFKVKVGVVKISFRHLGYGEVEKEIMVFKGDSIELNIAMHPQPTEMERVVISAGRAEQKLSDLTVSVSLIQPESIESAHITDAQELINRSSGIEVLDGQASIRGGSGFSYGAGSRVMVLVDGLPIISADAGHVRWQELPFENISQVEVIKGASSVMYGSSALNGIINFRTQDADEVGVTKFFAESGFFDSPERIAWKWWDRPRLFSAASVSHLKRYGNTDVSAGAFLNIDNGYRKLNENNYGRINLRIKQNNPNIDGLSYGLAMNGMHTQKQDFILWENGYTGALKQDTSTAQKMSGTSLTLDPTVSYTQSHRIKHDLRTRFRFTKNEFPENGDNNSDAFSQYLEYQFQYRVSKIVSLNTGISQYFSQVLSPFYGDHKSLNSALYVQADITPMNRLNFVAGFRLENNTLDGIKDNTIPLFRSGINYRVFDLTFLRASWGQGYRYPSIAEKFASTTLGAVKLFPNPNIRPESGWNSEIAIKQGLQTSYFNGLIDLALFYTQNKDLIEYVFGIYPDPVTQSYDLGFRAANIENSRVYGFELEFMANTVLNNVSYTLSGGYVYMHPVVFDPATNKNKDEYLKFRRKHALSLNMNASYKKYEINIQAIARSRILNVDDVFLNPATREDILPGFFDYWEKHNNSYFLMDVSLAYNISDRYKISLAFKNITNTEYMGRPGDIQPHRNFRIRVSGTL